MERDHRRQPLDGELGEGATRPREGFLAGGSGDDEFGEHRIELAADHTAGFDTGIDAHPRTRRGDERGDRARCGQEPTAGVFAVDPELERMPARFGIFGDRQFFTVGDPELLQHQIDAGGFLGDGVFDLQAGVDLQERHEAVLADEVFDRSGTVVAGFEADRFRRRVDFLALGVGEERGGGFFDEFLEAALQRAVAGACDDDVAVLVGDDLRFDVAGLVEVPLDEAFPAPERGDRFAGGRVEQLGDLLAGAGDFHAASAATERGFDRDRQTVLVGEGEDLVGVLHRFGGARHGRGFRAGGDVAGGDLVTEVADRLRRRPDPDQPGIDHGLGEVGVLGEEPVAGVDGVGTGLGGGVEDLVDHQIRLRRGLTPEGERLVGQPNERGIGIGLGVHSDTGQPGIGGRPDHPHRDLATIGDKNLGDLSTGMAGH